MDAGLKQVKVIGNGEDGGRKWVQVSRDHRDLAKELAWFLFNLTANDSGVREPRVS